MKVVLYTTHSYETCMDRLKRAADVRRLLSPYDWFLRAPSGKPVIGWVCGSRFHIEKAWLVNKLSWREHGFGFYGRLKPDRARGGTWIVGSYGLGALERVWHVVSGLLTLAISVPAAFGYVLHRSVPPASDFMPACALALGLVLLNDRWRSRVNEGFLIGFLKQTLEAAEQPMREQDR